MLFYLKRKVGTGHSFFNRISFFSRISLNHPFFNAGLSFNRAVAAIHFFRGYMEQLIFDSSYLLIRPATFFGDLSDEFDFIKDSLFI